ncbi:MAG: methylated-DNA--[protein]-cysteine S-methyltransferase [Chloroflexi bacterium]|nr:methylated-DNA--[protein]-cysteine S-methyltransferase [Chloroflexota bacterium]
MKLYREDIESPIGTLTAVASPSGLCALGFFDRQEEDLLACLHRRFPQGVEIVQAPAPGDIAEHLRAYFAGKLEALDAIPVDAGGTAFQQRAWTQLRRIPPGTTVTYGQLAATIGLPRAIRAVGLANARNPVAIVVPCHRVIGANGSLTGYAGGLERKRWLLDHERHFAA